MKATDQPLVQLAGEIGGHTIAFVDNNRKLGSGVYIQGVDDRFYILTASHVWNYALEESPDCVMACHFNDCTCLLNEDLVFVSEVEDWAVIRVVDELLTSTPAPMAIVDPYIGEQIVSMGYPSGKNILFTPGYVSGYTGLKGEPFPHLTITGYAFYGSSGSGVYNINGELVGLITGIGNRTDPVMGLVLSDPNIAYAIPIEQMEELVFVGSDSFMLSNGTISNSNLPGIFDIISVPIK